MSGGKRTASALARAARPGRGLARVRTKEPIYGKEQNREERIQEAEGEDAEGKSRQRQERQDHQQAVNELLIRAAAWVGVAALVEGKDDWRWQEERASRGRRLGE